MEKKDLNRRSFFKATLSAFVAAPFLFKMLGNASAASCSKTPPAGKPAAEVGVGMAKGLDYVDLAESSKNPKYKAGQNCLNCKYYNDKKAEGGYAPCTMMGMKFVTSCGWCKSYLKKA